MNDPSRARRRVALLAGLVVLIVAATAGLYAFRQVQQAAQADRWREQGFAAAAEGDHARAVEQLTRYVRRRSGDAEALRTLADAKLAIVQPGGRHLAEAVSLLQRAESLDGGDPATRALLLDLCIQLGLHDRIVQLTHTMLEDGADDLAVIRARLDAMLALSDFESILEETEPLLAAYEPDQEAFAVALERRALALASLGRSREAIRAAERLLESHPDRHTAAIVKLETAIAAGEDPASLIEWARARQAERPSSSGPAMVLALAHRYAGDPVSSVRWMVKAGELDPQDPTVPGRLTRELAALGRFDAAAAMARRYHVIHGGEAAFALVTHYHALARGFEALLEWTRSVKDRPASHDASVVALRAMALLETQREDEAAALLLTLGAREGSPRAQAWRLALEARYDVPRAEKLPPIQALNQAVELDGRNPWSRHWLGEASYGVGEIDAAAQQWRRAAELEPGWASPQLGLVTALRAQGHFAEAVAASRRLLLIAPDATATTRTFVITASHVASRVEAAAHDQLLATCDRLLRALPDDAELYAAKARLLLAFEGRQPAVDFVTQALAELPLDAEARRALVAVEDELNLDLTDTLVQQADTSPEAAIALARRRIDDGMPQAAIDGYTAAMDDAEGHDDARWRLGFAVLLEKLDDDGALAAWKRVAEAAEGRPNVLASILDASSPLTDAEFYRDTIDRLREATGPGATRWKLAEAKYLLQHDPSPDSLSRVDTLLQSVSGIADERLDAALLRAELHRLRGETASRLEQLRLAWRLSDRHPQVGMRLIEVYETAGRFEAARDLARNLADDAPADDPALAHRIASALLRTGDLDRARRVLEPVVTAASPPPAEAGVLLATLHERRGDFEAAEAIYLDLLEGESTAGHLAAVGFFERRGLIGRAREVFEPLLAGIDDPVERLLQRAELERRLDNPEAAGRLLREAVQTTPASPHALRRWIAHRYERAGAQAALASTQDALARVPQDQAFEIARRALTAMQTQPDLRPGLEALLLGVLATPDQAPILAEGVAALTGKGSPSERVDALAQLATIRESEAISLAAVRLLWPIDAARAARQAEQASRRFPGADLPRWAAMMRASQGDWARALASAEVWNHRTASGDARALAMIVRCRAELGQSSPALTPRLVGVLETQGVRAEPDRGVLGPVARALIAAGQEARVRDTLLPRLHDGDAWRELWLDLAAEALPTDEQAMAWLGEARAVVDLDQPADALAYAAALERIARRFDRSDLQSELATLLGGLVDRSPSDVDLRLRHAVALERAGRVPEAIQRYEQVLRQRPDDPLALNNLAMLLVASGGDVDRAVTLIDRAVTLRSEVAAIHDTQAQVYAAAGRDQQAVDAFREAMRLDPASPRWPLHLARHLLDIGQPGEVPSLLRTVDAAVRQADDVLPDDLHHLRQAIEADMMDASAPAPDPDDDANNVVNADTPS